MKQKKRIIFLALVLALFFSTTDLFSANVAFGKVQKIAGKGLVNVTKQNSAKSTKAFKNMKLNEGDKIVTEKDASVQILMEKKILLLLEGNTEAILEKNSKAKDNKGYERFLKLEKGSVIVDVDKQLGTNDKVEVRTPTMVAGVRGTSFGIAVRNNKYYIEVYSGVVTLTPNSENFSPEQMKELKPIHVKEGENFMVRNDKFVEDFKKGGIKEKYDREYPNLLKRFEKLEKDYKIWQGITSDNKITRPLKKTESVVVVKEEAKLSLLDELMQERKDGAFGKFFQFEVGYSNEETFAKGQNRPIIKESPSVQNIPHVGQWNPRCPAGSRCSLYLSGYPENCVCHPDCILEQVAGGGYRIRHDNCGCNCLYTN